MPNPHDDPAALKALQDDGDQLSDLQQIQGGQQMA